MNSTNIHRECFCYIDRNKYLEINKISYRTSLILQSLQIFKILNKLWSHRIQQSTISPTHSMEFGYGQQGTSTVKLLNQIICMCYNILHFYLFYDYCIFCCMDNFSSENKFINFSHNINLLGLPEVDPQIHLDLHNLDHRHMLFILHLEIRAYKEHQVSNQQKTCCFLVMKNLMKILIYAIIFSPAATVARNDTIHAHHSISKSICTGTNPISIPLKSCLSYRCYTRCSTCRP